LRHLKALVFDERLVHQWSSPSVLPLIFFIMNSSHNSETGTTPFAATFGDEAATYFKLPEVPENSDLFNDYVNLLNANLSLIRSISYNYQQQLIQKRSSKVTTETQNLFQPGDLVLFQLDSSKPLPSKLSPKYLGPYIVIQQRKNDVECRHVNLGNLSTLHVERLKPFFGTLEAAKAVSLLDENQYLISTFLDYRGDPLTRTTMEFLVRFADSSEIWLPYSRDLSDSLPFETYCRSNFELYPLLFTAAAAKTWIKEINQKPITEIKPGDTAYVNLRSYGSAWYDALQLPSQPGRRYVIAYKYGSFSNSSKRKIHCSTAVFDESFVVDHFFIFSYGQTTTFDSSFMVLIDAKFVLQFPQVLPEQRRAKLLARYAHLK
jgi:hypothetical protein